MKTVRSGQVAEAADQSAAFERLPFVREQAVSITAPRFGTPDPLAHEVL